MLSKWHPDLCQRCGHPATNDCLGALLATTFGFWYFMLVPSEAVASFVSSSPPSPAPAGVQRQNGLLPARLISFAFEFNEGVVEEYGTKDELPKVHIGIDPFKETPIVFDIIKQHIFALEGISQRGIKI